MAEIKEILFFIVVFISNVIQCITGFAGTVLAMPFSLMLVGYETAKPVLNVLGIVASIGVVLTNKRGFNKKEFFKIISVMLIGMVTGFIIIGNFSFSPELLYKLLGIIVVLFMLMGCYRSFFKKEKERIDKEKTNPVLYIVLVVAGIVHGMFVCGGPLMVIYANERLKNKDEFRVTVSAVWIVLNSIIMLSDIKSGYFDSKTMVLLAISIVILLIALFVGNIIYKHMNKKAFLVVTYILMGISGLSLILK